MGPRFHVLQVEVDHFLMGEAAPAVDLPEPGEARSNTEPGAGTAAGAAQATAAGLAIAAGGFIRDIFGAWAMSGALGPGMATPFAGYSFVYHVEIGLLFLTIVAIGPLVRIGRRTGTRAGFGLSEFPT